MGAKERFIQDTLSKEGRKMLEYQSKQIGSVLNSRTGRLLNSRSTRASSDRLVFEHPIYERYLDMKRISGKKKKSRKIHNRYVFGAFSSIAERLMYGFTDEVAAQFREMADEVGG